MSEQKKRKREEKTDVVEGGESETRGRKKKPRIDSPESCSMAGIARALSSRSSSSWGSMSGLPEGKFLPSSASSSSSSPISDNPQLVLLNSLMPAEWGVWQLQRGQKTSKSDPIEDIFYLVGRNPTDIKKKAAILFWMLRKWAAEEAVLPNLWVDDDRLMWRQLPYEWLQWQKTDPRIRVPIPQLFRDKEREVVDEVGFAELRQDPDALSKAVTLKIDLNLLSRELLELLAASCKRNKELMVTDLVLHDQYFNDDGEGLDVSLVKILLDIIKDIRCFIPGALLDCDGSDVQNECFSKLSAAMKTSKLLQNVRLDHEEGVADGIIGDMVVELFDSTSLKSFWLDISTVAKKVDVFGVVPAIFKSQIPSIALQGLTTHESDAYDDEGDSIEDFISQEKPAPNTSLIEFTLDRADLAGRRGVRVIKLLQAFCPAIRKLMFSDPRFLSSEAIQALCSWFAGSKIAELNLKYDSKNQDKGKNDNMGSIWQEMLSNDEMYLSKDVGAVEKLSVGKLLAESTTITHFSLVDDTLTKETRDALLEALRANYFITSAVIRRDQGPELSDFDAETARQIAEIFAVRSTIKAGLDERMHSDPASITLSYMPGMFPPQDSKKTSSASQPSSSSFSRSLPPSTAVSVAQVKRESEQMIDDMPSNIASMVRQLMFPTN